MNLFVKNLHNNKTLTTNGMVVQQGTGSALVDLFYSIGSARNTDIIPKFVAAFSENSDLAIRILLWARDPRGGAGERETFRKILSFLNENGFYDYVNRILKMIPEIGRFDDLLTVNSSSSFDIIKDELQKKNGLCAKWMPRKGSDAVALRNYLKLTPKQYRKLLVSLSNTVETKMCSKKWKEINYSHVPSVASSRYQKAFLKNDSDRYSEWKKGLESGKTKVNASVLYPYDVLRSIRSGDVHVSEQQWKQLPDYCNGSKILPVVDVSGSMTCKASGSLTCLDVALSLGLYLSDKNKGEFKNVMVTFSDNPEFLKLTGSLSQKLLQMETSRWEMSTNLEKVFNNLLKIAVDNNVPEEDMPETILILSDMQFNSCIKNPSSSAFLMLEEQYLEAGYKIPKVVFWNIEGKDKNFPVSFNIVGTAMVSGFSPSILKSILKNDKFSSESIMMDAIMNPRYNF